MDDWFSVMAAGCELPASAVRELDDVGFVVVPGPVAPHQLSRLAAVYDAAVSAADPADVGGGRTSTRVWDFVNRAPDFDGLYIYTPILEACCRVIGAPFHLSTMHARAVNPGAPAQDLHADYRRTTDGWPMVGFIFMVDEFRRDNGATRFVPGSHRWPHAPSDVMQDATADYEGQVRRVVPQAQSSSTTAPCGTDMGLTRPRNRGGPFKVHTSAVTTNKGRTKRLGCVPKRLSVLEPLPSTF